MIEKLEAIKQRYDLLTEKIADPAVIAKMDEWQKIVKERSDMEETVEKIVEFARKSIAQFGNSDQYFILEEVCQRLQEEGSNALKMEYLMEEPEYE